MASELINSIVEAEKSGAAALQNANEKAEKMKAEAEKKAVGAQASYRVKAKAEAEKILKEAEEKAKEIYASEDKIATEKSVVLKAAAKTKGNDAVKAVIAEIIG